MFMRDFFVEDYWHFVDMGSMALAAVTLVLYIRFSYYRPLVPFDDRLPGDDREGGLPVPNGVAARNKVHSTALKDVPAAADVAVDDLNVRRRRFDRPHGDIAATRRGA